MDRMSRRGTAAAALHTASPPKNAPLAMLIPARRCSAGFGFDWRGRGRGWQDAASPAFGGIYCRRRPQFCTSVYRHATRMAASESEFASRNNRILKRILISKGGQIQRRTRSDCERGAKVLLR
jgi:hypothetical protein